MPASLVSLDPVLKDNYELGLRSALNNANPVLAEIERASKEDFQG